PTAARAHARLPRLPKPTDPAEPRTLYGRRPGALRDGRHTATAGRSKTPMADEADCEQAPDARGGVGPRGTPGHFPRASECERAHRPRAAGRVPRRRRPREAGPRGNR